MTDRDPWAWLDEWADRLAFGVRATAMMGICLAVVIAIAAVWGWL